MIKMISGLKYKVYICLERDVRGRNVQWLRNFYDLSQEKGIDIVIVCKDKISICWKKFDFKKISIFEWIQIIYLQGKENFQEIIFFF